MPVGEMTFSGVARSAALNNEARPRICFMRPKQDVALMSCLVCQSYYVQARLRSIKRSVWFIIKERSECVECTYSAALQKDNSNNSLSIRYASHFKSHLDTSINRRGSEIKFEVER